MDTRPTSPEDVPDRIPRVWNLDPVAAARALVVQESDLDQERAAGFALTAAWTVEALHYLVDLDAHLALADRLSAVLDYAKHPVELAHARWAAGDAMTAVDLCSAALGRLFASYPNKRGHEMDFGHAPR
jgi:hypothetical protein